MSTEICLFLSLFLCNTKIFGLYHISLQPHVIRTKSINELYCMKKQGITNSIVSVISKIFTCIVLDVKCLHKLKGHWTSITSIFLFLIQ